MNETLHQIRGLVRAGDVRISSHGYDELMEDEIFARDAIEGVENALVAEEYPDYPKGRCVLVLQKDREGEPVHLVWAFQKEPTPQLFWSPPIGPIPGDGPQVF